MRPGSHLTGELDAGRRGELVGRDRRSLRRVAEVAQPIGAHDAYSAGAKVSHSEKKWTSDLDNNVWEPGVYGWTEVKDLDAMTVAELKEYASENGIALTGLTLKADILAAIKTAEGVTA